MCCSAGFFLICMPCEWKRSARMFNEAYPNDNGGLGASITKVSMIIWRVLLISAIGTLIYMQLGLKLDAHIWKHEIPANIWADLNKALFYQLLVGVAAFAFANTFGCCLGSPH